MKDFFSRGKYLAEKNVLISYLQMITLLQQTMTEHPSKSVFTRNTHMLIPAENICLPSSNLQNIFILE